MKKYQKKSDGTPNANWTKQPATMIEKVAKVRALREAFVEDLGGMYDADEIDKKEELTKTHGSDKIIVEQNEEEQKEAIGEVNINEI